MARLHSPIREPEELDVAALESYKECNPFPTALKSGY
jgi:hypothetical protein